MIRFVTTVLPGFLIVVLAWAVFTYVARIDVAPLQPTAPLQGELQDGREGEQKNELKDGQNDGQGADPAPAGPGVNETRRGADTDDPVAIQDQAALREQEITRYVIAGLTAYDGGRPKEAFENFKKAAEAGDRSAQAALGQLYLNGEGVAHDAETAVRWYEQAANQCASAIQATLGSLYEDDRDIPQDLSKAYFWYGLAAQTYPAGDTRIQATEDKERIGASLNEEERQKQSQAIEAWLRRYGANCR